MAAPPPPPETQKHTMPKCRADRVNINPHAIGGRHSKATSNSGKFTLLMMMVVVAAVVVVVTPQAVCVAPSSMVVCIRHHGQQRYGSDSQQEHGKLGPASKGLGNVGPATTNNNTWHTQTSVNQGKGMIQQRELTKTAHHRRRHEIARERGHAAAQAHEKPLTPTQRLE